MKPIKIDPHDVMNGLAAQFAGQMYAEIFEQVQEDVAKQVADQLSDYWGKRVKALSDTHTRALLEFGAVALKHIPESEVDAFNADVTALSESLHAGTGKPNRGGRKR